jgi:hypothetical protein
MADPNGKFLLPITFHPITDKILEQLKVLNSAIFPIKYQVSGLLLSMVPSGSLADGQCVACLRTRSIGTL